ncbi:MAG: hypothetical protein Tp1123DCM1511741_48 [Prokaryotic dsDNA virus sp.]|nr:MAG: hypothetical protein Tp1123DCM1511741_48 [Prokaryotic dsDNA virus sp.]|tara:strand:- start:510 stop:776 length:267 start_codon:yes stop_codon:yes gene_type:complete
MWIKKKINVDEKKLDAEVQFTESKFIQVECRYDKKLMSAKSVTIDNKKYDVTNCLDVGFRHETILITLWSDNNEHKSVESRKNPKLSK